MNKKFLLFNNNIINQEMKEIRLRIKLHINNIIFNIIIIKIYNIILKMLWLKDIDSNISFYESRNTRI